MDYCNKISEIQSHIPQQQKLFISKKFHSCIFSNHGNQDFLIHCSCVQGWFTRCSWLTKINFVRQLLELSRPFIIKMLRSYIYASKTKDLIYTINDASTQYFNDRIAHDDNRTLEEVSLELTKSSDLQWYADLSSAQQYHLLVNLFRITGGYIMHEVHSYIKNNEIMRTPDPDSIGIINFIDQENLDKDPIEKQEFSADFTLTPSPELERLQKKWNYQLNEMRRELGLEIPIIETVASKEDNKKRPKSGQSEKSMTSHKSTTKKKKSDQKSTLDMVQMFPLWINRKILSYFTVKELAVLKDVNIYWRAMVDDVLAIMRFRAKFEKKLKILKMQANIRSAEVHKNMYHEVGVPTYNSQHSFQKVKPAQRIQRIRKLLKKNKSFRSFSFYRYFTVKLLQSYDLTRRTAISDKFRVFASTSLLHKVTVYSLISGMALRHCSIDSTKQNMSITSLVFHDHCGLLLLGTATGLIICWSMWTFEKLNTYYGHSSPVTLMTVANNQLISISIQMLIIIDLPVGLQTALIKMHIPICAIAPLDASDMFFVAFQNGELIKYKLTGSFIESTQAHIGACTSVKCSSFFLITGGLDRFIRIWDVNDLSKGCLLGMEHRSEILCVNAIGSTIFAGSRQGILYIWNLSKEKLERAVTIGRIKNPIRSIYFSSTKLQRCQLIVVRDLDVHVLEFYQPKKQAKKTSRLYVLTNQGTNIVALPEPEPGVESMSKSRQTRAYYRMETLLWRGCTDPILRGRVCPPNSTKAVLTNAIRTYSYFHESTNRKIEFFPRCIVPANDTTFMPSLAAPNRFIKLATIPQAELMKRYGNKSLMQVLHPYRVTI